MNFNDSTPHSAQIHREAIAKTWQNSYSCCGFKPPRTGYPFGNECDTGQTAVVVENIAPPADYQWQQWSIGMYVWINLRPHQIQNYSVTVYIEIYCIDLLNWLKLKNCCNWWRLRSKHTKCVDSMRTLKDAKSSETACLSWANHRRTWQPIFHVVRQPGDFQTKDDRFCGKYSVDVSQRLSDIIWVSIAPSPTPSPEKFGSHSWVRSSNFQESQNWANHEPGELPLTNLALSKQHSDKATSPRRITAPFAILGQHRGALIASLMAFPTYTGKDELHQLDSNCWGCDIDAGCHKPRIFKGYCRTQRRRPTAGVFQIRAT